MSPFQGKVDTVFTGATSQVEQSLARYVAQMAQDETILRSGARFKIIVYLDYFDFDRFGPTIMKGAFPLQQVTHSRARRMADCEFSSPITLPSVPSSAITLSAWRFGALAVG